MGFNGPRPPGRTSSVTGSAVGVGERALHHGNVLRRRERPAAASVVVQDLAHEDLVLRRVDERDRHLVAVLQVAGTLDGESLVARQPDRGGRRDRDLRRRTDREPRLEIAGDPVARRRRRPPRSGPGTAERTRTIRAKNGARRIRATLTRGGAYGISGAPAVRDSGGRVRMRLKSIVTQEVLEDRVPENPVLERAVVLLDRKIAKPDGESGEADHDGVDARPRRLATGRSRRASSGRTCWTP